MLLGQLSMTAVLTAAVLSCYLFGAVIIYFILNLLCKDFYTTRLNINLQFSNRWVTAGGTGSRASPLKGCALLGWKWIAPLSGTKGGFLPYLVAAQTFVVRGEPCRSMPPINMGSRCLQLTVISDLWLSIWLSEDETRSGF